MQQWRHPIFLCLWALSLVYGAAAAAAPAGRETLQVRGDFNYPPYEFLDEKGRPTGFNVDLMRAVGEVMGLPLDIQLGPWQRVRRELETGAIDALTGMYYSKNRDLRVDFSNPHIIVSHAIFVRRGAGIKSLEDLRGKSIVVQAGDIMHDFVVSQGISDHIITVENQIDALRLLASGAHDGALLGKLQGMFWLYKFNLSNLEAVGPPIEARNYCFAVPQGREMLLGQLNEGLSILKRTGRFDEIYQQWFGVYDERASRGRALKLAGLVLVPLLLLAAAFWFWSMRRTLAARTRALQQELGERQRAQTALKQAGLELEERVAHRTAELRQTNDRLSAEIERRRQAQAALRESEERFRTLFEAAQDGIFIKDRQGCYRMVNPGAERFFGIPAHETLGRCDAEIFGDAADAHSRELDRRVFAGEIVEEEISHSVDGRPSSFHLIKVPIRDRDDRIIGLCGIARDISEMKVMETQLRHSQKMESVGTLAGGIAHDFNNILGIIIGNAELATDDIPDGSPARHNIDEILTASRRARDVIRQLLSFSRKADVERQVVGVTAIVAESLQLLRSSIPAGIEIRRRFSAEWDSVETDASQIHQIMINLCTNAVHAMPAQGGVLVVELADLMVGPEYGSPSPELGPGCYLRLTVKDSGHGIAPEVISRIFDPYFTTKSVGKGTGMGLAVVHGIVKNHQGAITVDSGPGEGTAFNVFLPLVPKKVVASPAAPEDLPKGAERILFVDDEAALADMGRVMLERLGYQVEVQTDPRQALLRFQEAPGEFNLVITDMAMPGMNGDALVKSLKALRPDLPVILCTGFSETVSAESAARMGISRYIEKPVNKQVLATAVREALNGS